MTLYVLLTSLTGEGRKTIKERPERIREVNKEVEDMGVTVIAQYAVLGLYDFINVVEAPDIGTITRLAVELGSRGTMHVMSMPAMPLDDFIATIKS